MVLNLIGSTLFLFAVGTLYGVLGTLNMADLAVRLARLAPEDLGLVRAAGLLLFVVFALKAALVPLYLWLPAAYGYTSAPVAALFAIMTKVGVYAILRVYSLMFGAGQRPGRRAARSLAAAAGAAHRGRRHARRAGQPDAWRSRPPTWSWSPPAPC